jgi:hypothetical protein
MENNSEKSQRDRQKARSPKGTGKKPQRDRQEELPTHVANREVAKNYKAFKNFIIRFKHEREGSLDIDYIEAADLAWELAEQLPDGIVLDGGKLNRETIQPEGPNWFDWFCYVLMTVAVALFISYIAGYIFS